MIRLLITLLILPFILFAKPKICLNMIVKDEAEIITRCLDSVKPYIDYWVIVDTGSKDGTQKIIKKHMKGIPGVLYERPWKSWGETRTEALKLAQGKGDYILFMDADDVLKVDPGYKFEDIKSDVCHMWRGSKGFRYVKPQIAKSGLPWKWVGLTHEYLDCEKPYTSEILTKVQYIQYDDSATRKNPKQKYLKNVELLEAGLKKEPDNSRYVLYLAESYNHADEPGKALQWYQKREKMGGWAEEVFWSKFEIAQMLQKMGAADAIVIQAYQDAHQYRPHRVEPIYYLAEIYNRQENHAYAYALINAWKKIKQPAKDHLFNYDWITEFGLDFQLSICSYYTGNYEESLKICDRLLENEDLPASWKELTVVNRTFPEKKLKEKGKKS